MANYYLPDLSGTNPDYKKDAEIITLRQTGVRYEFNTPVFKTGFAAFVVGDSGDLLVENIDWVVEAVDIDESSLARVSNIDPSYNKVLLKSIKFIRSITSSPVKIQMSYQQLYPVSSKSAASNNELVELTPDLILNLMGRVSTLEAQSYQIPDTGSDNDTTPTFLEYDIDGENPNNVVRNESHIVNVFQNKNLIFPAQGSFFADSVVITIPEQAYTCVYGEDYTFAVLNHGKTKLSSNTSGIYEIIQITRPFAGTVRISEYHAVGGEVTLNDAKAINNRVENLTRYLEDTEFVTAGSLAQQLIIQSMQSRITALEDNVRAILSGSPSYGDASGGEGVGFAKRIRANDTGLHWWTLARLRTVQGSTDIILADNLKLHLQMVTAKLQVDVNISADITTDTQLSPKNKLSIDSSGVLQNVGYTLYGDTSSATLVTMPKFRIIWNETVGNDSGIILQIGLTLPSLTETIGISNRSGMESCWIIDTSPGTVGSPIQPSDDTITLPDGASVWSSASGTSKRAVAMMPNKSGYLVWTGTKDLVSLDSDLTAWTIPHLLPAYFEIADIDHVRVELRDNGGNLQSTIIPVSGGDAYTRIGRGTVVIGDNAIPLTLTLTKNSTTGIITAVMSSSSTASGLSTTFAIRYLIAKFD